MEEKIVQNQQVEFQSQPPRAWFRIALFLALGVVLVGVLVFAGIQIGKEQATRDTKQERRMTPAQIPVVTSAPTLSPETTPFPDETAEWKTYTHSTGKFSVKWKDGWYEPRIDVIKKEHTESLKELLVREDSIRQQDRLCLKCFKVLSERETKVDKHLAIFREEIGHPEGKTLNAYVLMNNEKIVRLRICCGDPASDKEWNEHVPMSEVRNQFNQILSTFKFLD